MEFNDIQDKIKESCGGLLETYKKTGTRFLGNLKAIGRKAVEQPRHDSKPSTDASQSLMAGSQQPMNELQSSVVSLEELNVDFEQISFMVSVDGQEAGPYTIPELQQFVATGEFTPQVYVWRDGMPQWEPASNVPELAGLFSY